MEVFNDIWDYLRKEQVSALDVILISLATTFIAWLLKSIGNKLFGIVNRGVKKFREAIKEFYRKRIKASLNVKEIIEIQKKISNNTPLKRYEKKAYEKYTASFEDRRKKMADKFNLTEESMQALENFKLPKKKPVYSPKGIYFVDDEEKRE